MKILLLLTVLCLAVLAASSEKIVNCYYGTWATYRPGNGKFEPNNIDPMLCTHLSYSFFGINTNGDFTVLDSWLDMDSGKGFIGKVIKLKQVNPKLKVLAVVGGWNEGSTKYSAMAADANMRARFIKSSIDFIRQHGFDGLDLDWEYPAQRGGSAADRVNFVTLLRELKAALSVHGLILGIAVAASQISADLSYDIPNVAKNVDFINVMTYDFSTHWDGVLGFNAPLRGPGVNNVESSIKYWLQHGAPSEKLILGIGFYGRTFTTSGGQIAPGVPSIGAGLAGPYTQEAGFLGYNEICADEANWQVRWNEQYGVPYAYKDNQWIGYDDVKSIDLKMKFLKELNLGGAMIWSIETDDFLGLCGGVRFPLLNTINKALTGYNGGGGSSSGGGSGTVITTVRPAITTTTTVASNAGAGDNDNCSRDGYFVKRNDCTSYYQCVGGHRYDFQCSGGLYFDVASMNCNWPSMVKCG